LGDGEEDGDGLGPYLEREDLVLSPSSELLVGHQCLGAGQVKPKALRLAASRYLHIPVDRKSGLQLALKPHRTERATLSREEWSGAIQWRRRCGRSQT